MDEVKRKLISDAQSNLLPHLIDYLIDAAEKNEAVKNGILLPDTSYSGCLEVIKAKAAGRKVIPRADMFTWGMNYFTDAAAEAAKAATSVSAFAESQKEKEEVVGEQMTLADMEIPKKNVLEVANEKKDDSPLAISSNAKKEETMYQEESELTNLEKAVNKICSQVREKKIYGLKDVAEFLLDTCKNDEKLLEKVLQPWKSMDRCWKYITGRAKERIVLELEAFGMKASGAVGGKIEDETVYGWAVKYFNLDDRAEVEAEEKAAAEAAEKKSKLAAKRKKEQKEKPKKEAPTVEKKEEAVSC